MQRSYRYRDYLAAQKDVEDHDIKDLDKRIDYIHRRIKMLKSKLYKSFKCNESVRSLRESSVKDNKIISVFESVLTRTLGINKDELSDSIMVVQAFYFEVLEDLIKNGYDYHGEHYCYFSSSSGQIRTKKCVFIKEKLWNDHQHSLMCGLTIDEINSKGGMSVNKFLAYKALTNSASAPWEDFDITKSIVVDDVETEFVEEVDYIDRNNFEITRKKMPIKLEITDGAGMILPSLSDKSFMYRMPFCKGLLSPFDFHKFALKNGNTKVTDTYGKEWDIIEDDIQIIFFKSQFKMKNYYNSWEDYQDKFIKHNCEAAMLNEEDDVFSNASLNYQMIQTLYDLHDDELEELAKDTIEDILKIGEDKDTMLRVLGATESNNQKNYFQEAIYVYNELLNDQHSKETIRAKKKSLIKDAKSGKLAIDGVYTFLLPDYFAACEKIFLGIDNPKGLLEPREVFTNLYDEGTLDLLRSPHLYFEHCLRENNKDNAIKDWFTTNGVYISSQDILPKVIMCDFDGDKALITPNKTLIEAVKRHSKNVVPLEYEMSAAPKQILSSENMYNSLTIAFRSNIGIISNDISKIWNSDNIDIEAVKILTSYNNFVIDHAKTLDLPEFPKKIKSRLKSQTNQCLPHFFVYAKDKEVDRVQEKNNSAMNRLDDLIPNNRIKFRSVGGKFDYKMLMNNHRMKIDEDIIKVYTKLDRSKKWIMNNEIKHKSKDKLYIYKYIREELLKLNSNPYYVTDVLVKFLYDNKKSRFKTTLWESFGREMLNNIKNNLSGLKSCEDCGMGIERIRGKKICEKCYKKREYLRNKANRTAKKSHVCKDNIEHV